MVILPVNETDHEKMIVGHLTEIQLPLRLYVQSLLPGDPAAGDVAQLANATIWTRRGDFTAGTNFKAWAFAIARFEVLNHRKRQARDARLVFSEELEETFAEDLASQHGDLERRHSALKTCLDKLRPKDRDLLLYRYSRAGTLDEFAARVGRSAAGLRVTLHRLRNTLLECMHRQLSLKEGQP